jgi:hypothetical protein
MDASLIGKNVRIIIGDQVVSEVQPLDIGPEELTMSGRHVYVSPRLRNQLGWRLPSNARLARRRRHIERIKAQRIGRR